MKKALIILPLLALMAFGTVHQANATEQDLPATTVKYHGMTLADLNQSGEILVVKCGLCHKIYDPETFSPD